jgi:hypothetical protein
LITLRAGVPRGSLDARVASDSLDARRTIFSCNPRESLGARWTLLASWSLRSSWTLWPARALVSFWALASGWSRFALQPSRSSCACEPCGANFSQIALLARGPRVAENALISR